MKLVIEINDETLHRAIGNQLQETVSRIVHERIEEQIDVILKTKLDRAGTAIDKAAEKSLAAYCNQRGANVSYVIDQAVKAAAEKLVREKLK